MADRPIKTLTYTSLARLDLSAGDLRDIHETARHLNALEGTTGLLIFNGSRFLQIIEGDPVAIDGLVDRLRSDHRHSAFEIRDERMAQARSFPDWSMELVRVSTSFQEARREVEEALPEGIEPMLRALVVQKASTLGATVSLAD